MGKTKGLRIIDYTKGSKLKVSKAAPRKRKGQPETILQNEIVDFINAHEGFKVRRIKNMGTYDPVKRIWRANTTLKGLLDIVGFGIGGKHVGIEVKMPNKEKTLTPEQKQEIADINAGGGYAIVATCLKDVALLIERMRFENEHNGNVYSNQENLNSLKCLTECF